MFNGHITLDINQNQSIKNVFLLYNGGPATFGVEGADHKHYIRTVCKLQAHLNKEDVSFANTCFVERIGWAGILS